MTVAPPPFEAGVDEVSTRSGNALLAALPQAVVAELSGDLQYLHMPQGMVLSAPDSKSRHAYFPTTAIASLLYVTREGAAGQVAIIGNDGLIGMTALAGAQMHAVVQLAGCGYRIGRELLERRSAAGGALHDVLLRYLHALLGQVAQTAICNRHHRLDQHLCRWLLLVLDRLPAQCVPVTQEVIANLLGVRRESISEAASRLKALGVIDYSRGRIEVLDRSGLEEAACECYGVMKAAHENLFGRAQTWRPENTPRSGEREPARIWPARRVAPSIDLHRT